MEIWALVALVVILAVYLLPYLVGRREVMGQSNSEDRYSAELRVLETSDEPSAADEACTRSGHATIFRRPPEVRAMNRPTVRNVRSVRTERELAQARRARNEAREARRAAAGRRAAVFAVLVAVSASLWIVGLATPVPWWPALIPTALLGVSLMAGRRAAIAAAAAEGRERRRIAALERELLLLTGRHPEGDEAADDEGGLTAADRGRPTGVPGASRRTAPHRDQGGSRPERPVQDQRTAPSAGPVGGPILRPVPAPGPVGRPDPVAGPTGRPVFVPVDSVEETEGPVAAGLEADLVPGPSGPEARPVAESLAGSRPGGDAVDLPLSPTSPASVEPAAQDEPDAQEEGGPAAGPAQPPAPPAGGPETVRPETTGPDLTRLPGVVSPTSGRPVTARPAVGRFSASRPAPEPVGYDGPFLPSMPPLTGDDPDAALTGEDPGAALAARARRMPAPATPPQGWRPVHVPAPTYTLAARAPRRMIEDLDTGEHEVVASPVRPVNAQVPVPPEEEMEEREFHPIDLEAVLRRRRAAGE